MKLTSVVAALLVAVAVAYWFVVRHDVVTPDPTTAEATTEGDEAAADRTPPVAVQVMTSQARDSASTLIVRGRTAANRVVDVAAQVNGRVISEPQRRGATVAEGTVLCHLDPATSQAELAEAEAALAEAEAEAAAAEQLSSKGFTADTTLKARRAALRAAQARRDKTLWEIGQLAIHAPFDGILETDAAELGAYLRPGDLCATVIDLSRLKVEGFVSEEEIDRLSIGQPAAARLVTGQRATGEITFLARVADPNTRTYAVEVTLKNTDARFRDGMTAELAIALPTVQAHLVPQSALTLDNHGRLGVRAAVDGIARFMPARIIGEDRDGFWLVGLPDTVDIIVVGQEFVRDGRAVAPSMVEVSQ